MIAATQSKSSYYRYNSYMCDATLQAASSSRCLMMGCIVLFISHKTTRVGIKVEQLCISPYCSCYKISIRSPCRWCITPSPRPPSVFLQGLPDVLNSYNSCTGWIVCACHHLRKSVTGLGTVAPPGVCGLHDLQQLQTSRHVSPLH